MKISNLAIVFDTIPTLKRHQKVIPPDESQLNRNFPIFHLRQLPSSLSTRLRCVSSRSFRLQNDTLALADEKDAARKRE